MQTHHRVNCTLHLLSLRLYSSPIEFSSSHRMISPWFHSGPAEWINMVPGCRLYSTLTTERDVHRSGKNQSRLASPPLNGALWTSSGGKAPIQELRERDRYGTQSVIMCLIKYLHLPFLCLQLYLYIMSVSLYIFFNFRYFYLFNFKSFYLFTHYLNVFVRSLFCSQKLHLLNNNYLLYI